jgi:hypothetical protein
MGESLLRRGLAKAEKGRMYSIVARRQHSALSGSEGNNCENGSPTLCFHLGNKHASLSQLNLIV